VTSGADLVCKDGRTLNAHAADLVAPQTELNKECARSYFASLSNSVLSLSLSFSLSSLSLSLILGVRRSRRVA